MLSKAISSLVLTAIVSGAVHIPPIQAESNQFNPSRNFKIAQVFRQNSVLRAGESIEVRLDSSETLYIGKGERKTADLRVDQDVISANGTVLIPEGAIIGGEFVPVSGGAKFVAKTLTSRGGTVRLLAESDLINDVKDPRETGVGSIAGDAAIGGLAGALLGGIFGDRSISTEKILGGAAAGVIVGNVTAPQVVVIEPSTPFTIVTRNNITFTTRDNF
ncbi:hypothetical protein Syn7502_02092 [Synechococcus sp. PCC 7502]|uniref:hypothetical protein n=1 Tax=Synechococcus sp. PCC 7502 TaxID=1173263 RepID=UPI00029FA02E|nr:hypothetical protein [Synechococcus sp. PCC 7502]AFY74111.1 hypothetical protein Syn7502_02092 [Synechococcus sp. PCC 7502]